MWLSARQARKSSLLLKRYWDSFRSLFFTGTCLSCGRPLLPTERWLCSVCGVFEYLTENTCPRCGEPDIRGNCPKCARNKYHFNKAVSALRYTPGVRGLIHGLKYQQMRGIAEILAIQCVKFYHLTSPLNPPDLIIPVPLHKTRLRERGYNQSRLLAEAIAGQMNWNWSDQLMQRVRYTSSQTGLDMDGRQDNIRGAFRVTEAVDVAGKTILVVDDVFTTGSTVNEMAALLMSAGAKGVNVLTAARAGFYDR